MDTQEFWDDYQHLKKEVNKLRSSETRLKAIRVRYQALMQHLRVMVAVIDRDAVLQEINPAGLKLLERSEKELVGYPLKESFHDDDMLELERKALDAISSESVVRFDWTIRPFDGPAKWVAAVAIPVEDETQRVVAALVIARDMKNMLTMDEDLSQVADLVASMRLQVKDALE